MKKFLSVLMVGAMVFAMAGCGAEKVSAPTVDETEPSAVESEVTKPTEEPDETFIDKEHGIPKDTLDDEDGNKRSEKDTWDSEDGHTGSKIDVSVTGDTYQQYYDILRIVNEGANPVYSPVSLNTDLSLFGLCIEDGPALQEINAFTGGRPYLSYRSLGENDEGIYRIINRIWYDTESPIDFTNLPVQNYLYPIAFDADGRATAAKDRYVDEMTNGFITSTPTRLVPGVFVDFMNIVYFKDAWDCGDLETIDGTYRFTNADDTTVDRTFMVYESASYYENDTCYAVPMRYQSGMTFYAIYPKKGVDNIDFTNLICDANKQYNGVRVILPEFEVSAEMNISDYAEAIGLGHITEANPLFMDGPFNPLITQVVRIDVNHEGTEAAAVTEITAKNECAMIDNTLELVFDKPFAYMIEDINGDIAFMGQITHLD